MIGLARRRGKRAVALDKSLPAPVGGWNARESVASMPESDAVKMTDAWPNTTDVQLRRGFTDHVTGITGKTVETLAVYNFATSSKLFAVVDDDIYDVSSAGAVGSAEAATVVTNARFQHTNFRVPGGAHWLLMANGVDAPHWFDGTTWTPVTGVSSPAITGLTTTDIIAVTVHKKRVYLIQKDSSSAWYLATNAIGGAATELDLGPNFTFGGFLMAMATWTIDAGEGADDYAVFISSKGQAVVYQGTDPASANTWALVGVFNIGSPIGRRCFIKFGADLLIITQGGVVPLTAAMLNSRIQQSVAVSDKIRTVITKSVKSFGANFGWQLLQYPNENMLIVNVPLSTTVFCQYAMNTITGAWCDFTKMNAFCWELFNDEIYYGADATVIKAWTAGSDNGSNITADIIPAFSYFDTRSQKHWKMVRPIFEATGTPSLLMGMNVDYDLSAPVGVPTTAITNASVWDTAKWDVDKWGGALRAEHNWQTVAGIGFAGSLHIQITSKADSIKWLATDFVYERGAII